MSPALPRPVPSGVSDGSPNDNDKEHFGKLVDSADPARTDLDHIYSYSFMTMSVQECRALTSRFRKADPDNEGLTQVRERQSKPQPSQAKA